MGREIVTARDIEQRQQLEATSGRVAAGKKRQQKEPDTYSEVLLKSIPAEVVAVYIAVADIIAAATDAPTWLLWVVAAALAITTPFYLNKFQHVTKGKQLVFSFFSFAVWVLSLGDHQNPALALGWKPVFGAVLLPVYTLVVSVILYEKPKKTS